ncbi:MAG TPA: Na+/H+ antiporter subunit E [Blastocatellia bacterium]|nr:Na+/H+ antiporter subunit E [Blastocatellia bacterium]
MNAFFWNVLLALVWAALTGEFSPANLMLGFALGYLVLLFAQRAVGSPNYINKVRKVINLALYFLWELIKSNLRIAYDVVTPTHYMRPGVIAVPLDAETDAEITLLANMITLTPGTLSLDVSSDRRVLYIHAMYLDEIDETRSRIKDGFERRILEVLR